MKAKVFNLNNLLYLALILALVSSLGHVAFAFSTVNGSNWIEAYISAIAIDLGMLALAAGINKRKKERRSTKTLWAGVILFSIISTYANWLAGIIHVTPLDTDVSQIGAWLVSLRPILLSSVLPLLVIYLSEIVSGNYQVELNEAQKQAKRSGPERPKVSRDTSPMVSNSQMIPVNDTNDDTLTQAGDTTDDPLAVARDTKKAQADERREKVLSLLNSGMSQASIASELGVSIATIKRDTKSLNGQVKVTA